MGGANEYIRELSLRLSQEHDVDLISWGDRSSYEIKEGRLHIIHRKTNEVKAKLWKDRIQNPFLLEVFVPFGIDYFFSVFQSYPNIDTRSIKLASKYDVIIRIAFNSSKLPIIISERDGAPIIELPLAFGLPWYLTTTKNWFKFIHRRSIIGSILLRPITHIANFIVEKFEIMSLSSCNVVTVSRLDAQRISKHILKLPNYIFPMVSVSDSPPHYVENCTIKILFYSTKGLASVVATEYIITIAKILTSYSFLITGNQPAKCNKGTLPENVEIFGWLDEEKFEQLVKSSNIIIIPLIQGSGVQTKLIKAMSMGKPIITTSAVTKPFDGIENGKHLIIEDDPFAFMQKIVEVASDKGKMKMLGENAYRYYKDNLNNRILAERFLQIIGKTLKDG